MLKSRAISPLVNQWGQSDFANKTFCDIKLQQSGIVLIALPVDIFFAIATSDTGNQIIKWNQGGTTTTTVRFLTNINTTSLFGWVVFTKS